VSASLREPLLEVHDVVAGYVPGLPIVHGVSLAVCAREVVSIIGPNGAGKSTLLKALIGLVSLTAGRVTLRGADVSGLPSHALIRCGLAFVPQTGNIFSTLTVQENLVVGGHTVATGLADRLARAFEAFPDLAPKRRQKASVLSGGQRQMLAIARALMTDPSVILLDEPTAGLAPKVVGEVFVDLRRLAERGVAVLMVEQNAKAALRVSDRGYVLAEGRNRHAGQAAALLADPALGAAFLGQRPASSAGAH
jgi:ABC-type branched-subunit amino acid transport system ATPase component